MNIKRLDKILSNKVILPKDISIVFSDSYLPEPIHYRDEELEQIGAYIQGSESVLIVGDVGTGKTLCVQWLFDHYFKDKFPQSRYLYHNCRTSTLIEVYYSILSQLDIEFKKKQSISTYIIMIQEAIAKYEYVCICLDEINHLANKYNDPDLLYSFKDSNQINQSNHINLVLISNTSNWFDNVSKKTKDRLQLRHMVFRRYTINEIRGILEQRVEHSNTEKSIITLEEIKHLANIIYEEGGTIRDGINVLSNIFRQKMKHENTIYTHDELVSFFNQTKNYEQVSRMMGMKDQLRFCVFCITELLHRSAENFVTIEQVYKKWNKNASQSERVSIKKQSSIRNYMNELVTYNFLEVRNITRKGRKSYEYGYIPIFNVNEMSLFFQLNYSMGDLA